MKPWLLVSLLLAAPPADRAPDPLGGGSAGSDGVRFAGPPASTCASASDCTSGFCVDGVCCDSACGGGLATDCQACSMAAGAPTDGTCAPTSAATVCRSSGGPCDPAERCDGVGTACPANSLLPAGTTCRPSAGPCDVPDRCSGTSAICPVDTFVGAGVVCLPADPAFECDVDDTCDGARASCAPAFAPAARSCGAAPIGACDASDHCDGASADCVATFLAGVECRAASGPCDLAELCAGASASCPPDAHLPSGAVCRGSSEPSCDPAESCDGVTSTCPTDVTTCGLDAGTDASLIADASLADAATGDAALDADPPDAGVGTSAGPGCGCRASTRPVGVGAILLALLLGSIVARRTVRHA